MATCLIFDLGIAPQSPQPVRGADREFETGLQQFQNENQQMYPTNQHQENASEPAPSFGASEQSGRTLRLPLLVSIVQRQIELLPALEDVEIRPTSYAYSEAKQTVVSAYAAVFSDRHHRPEKLPTPIIGTDDVGGILISWVSGAKYLAAKFASQPELRSFLYFEEGVEHQALDSNEQNLVDRLRWLSNR